MANLNFKHSSAPLKTIQEIQFGLLSPDEIERMSVAQILYSEIKDESGMRPRPFGPNDPRLGSIDRGTNCATCGEDMNECPGHFGHITLEVPVFHVGFINKIKKLLESICHNCSMIKSDERDPKYVHAINSRDPKRRFDQVWRLARAKGVCEADMADDDDPNAPPSKEPKKGGHGGCGHLQPTIRRKGLQLTGTYKQPKGEDDEDSGKGTETKIISPESARKIFERIREEDLSKLGLDADWARPEWMILKALPVPPPPVRPSISQDGTAQGMRNEDDLTYKISDIVRANQNVKKCKDEGSPQHVTTEFENLLQYHIATFMDNQIAGVPIAMHKSGRPLKTVRARLKGKEGRLRGNLMGKRVDFSARTVITGDPNLSLDEVGVPRSTARILTYPETVTPYNIQKLNELVRNGPNEHPGAKYVIRDTGERIDLRHFKQAGGMNLQYGWKVERHLMDGDFVIFNRQPSLHKESMMGHRVRVMPYSTFRLNLSVTSPYNADFDGDEMNLHVPQSEETRAEIMELCMVPKNIVSPQRNGPLMGIVQDTLCGIYKICRRDVFLTKEHVMNILMWVPDWDGVIPQPAIVKPTPRWTGKQLISMVLPAGINLMRGGEPHPAKDEGCLVQGGELMYGLFNKGVVGSSAGGIIHIIFNERGWEAAVNFFNGAQKVVNYWLLHNGFSVGIGDTVPDPKTILAIQEVISEKKRDVEKIVDLATANKLDPNPGMTVRQTFESKVQLALNSAREAAGSKASDGLKDFNNAVQMSRSGSKGSAINISQMTALVGQQVVEGQRIPFGFKYRSLPHFPKDDYSPESRGFIENSYLRGLTPTEFFFHAMSGREGLIDTAVKTAETGYIQRRLVKALEDVMVKYDGTVRNSLGDIVQFDYGEDGLDGVIIENQPVDTVITPQHDFDEKVRVDVMSSDMSIPSDVLECANEIKGDIEVQRYLDEEYEQLEKDRDFVRTIIKKAGDMFQLPINVIRIIDTAKTKFRINSGASRSDLHPVEVITKVRELLDRLVVVRGDDPLSLEAQESATILVKCQLRSRLAFKRLAKDHRLNKLAFDNVLGDIENRFLRGAVSAGEMVGVLAAQSIGEPATQMTLNTFHFTGIASKNVTLGVPRLKEILNIAADIKTPSMRIFMDKSMGEGEEAAKILRSRLEHTVLQSVTDMTEIYYDPDVRTTNVEADLDMVESYFIIPEDSEEDLARQSKWVLRIKLGYRKLLDRGMTAADVAARIKEEYPGEFAVIFSDDNADEQVIRLRLLEDVADKSGDMENDEPDVVLKQIINHMLSLNLRGVPGVQRAFIASEQYFAVNEDGSYSTAHAGTSHTESVLDSTGSALAKTLAMDGVDAQRTTSNSPIEVFEVLGIEAARTSLLTETSKVLEFDGSYVNRRHLGLLVDIMTSRGTLMAISRHGINRGDTGALMRCSFEETVEILLEAAGNGELDDCRGISENVMLGQLAPLGTGEMQVYLDQNMLNTVTSDNARFGLMPGIAPSSGMIDAGAATPYGMASPSHEGGFDVAPDYGGGFSPAKNEDESSGMARSIYDGGLSPYSSISSPYGATSPFSGGMSPHSPGYSPTSPGYSPTSPGLASPRFSPTSPAMSAASPAYTPTSPNTYSPTSPAYGKTSPTSPSYSPTSPSYSPTSPSYSPTSPSFSPTSPAMRASATSPHYSPTSPTYSPTSPAYNAGPAGHSPTSPAQGYSPTSPAYSPTSPAAAGYSPTSPQGSYSPTSPRGYSPTSPNSYSPTSPSYSPTSPRQ